MRAMKLLWYEFGVSSCDHAAETGERAARIAADLGWCTGQDKSANRLLVLIRRQPRG
jgi:hypothetical protein